MKSLAVRPVASFLLVILAAAALVVSPVPADAADGVTLDKVFKGKVSIAKKRKKTLVTVRYDFRDKEQLKDWKDGAPLRIMGEVADKTFEWFDGQVAVPGTRSMHHIGTWTGDVSITATYRPDASRDVGCWMAPADGANDYCTFTLTEHYFHKWNGKAGGLHSIIQFGDQWREGNSGADYVGFRYVDRRPPPDELVPGRKYTFTARWEKGKFHFEMGKKFHLKGKHKGRKLGDIQVGFYTVVSRLLVDDVVITGELAPKWLEAQGAVLEVGPDDGLGGLPAEVQLLVNGHKAGKATSSAKLVTRLSNGGDAPPVRKAIIAALSAGPKKAVRQVAELLYHSEPSVRADGIGIVKALLGKTFGYNPKAKEPRRAAAIKKMNEALDKNPGLLED